MGTINSACQSCFDNKPDLFGRDFDLLKHPDKFRTLESTAEDLDRLEEKLLKEEDSTSLDNTQDKDSAQRKRYKKLSLEDFDVIKVIGHGTYGKVYLVQRKETKKYYTLKVMKKKDLVLKNLLKCVLNERNILQDLKHPFVVSLRTSFQTNTKAYLVTDYCSGGDLGLKLQKERRFDIQTVKFYAAELVLALEYLHEKLNIIHRDIKPENILIASDGHIKIADFGLAKSTNKALTLCGTLEYLAPEIIWGRAYGYAVDWWAFGCMLYEMLTGSTPFYDNNREKLFSNIMTNEPKMETWFEGHLKNLLSKLLVKNPKLRLGSQGAWEIKQHRFFKDVDWTAVLDKKLIPPFKEDIMKEEVDLQSTQFNKMISSGTLPRDSDITSNYNIDFPRFSFVAKDTVGEAPESQQDSDESGVKKGSIE